nr:hypothetical protein [Massilia sp. PDC64]
MMSAIVGCAVAGPNDRVRYALEIEVDKSLGKTTNIRYIYGDELVDQVRPIAIAIAPFTSYIATMHIPEEFQISWETIDDAKHEAEVPVRSRLLSSIEHKSIVFVIMPDHVEGYVGVSTPYGQKRERFY